MRQPTDKNGRPLSLTQNSTALAVTVDSTISSATSITLNTLTTLIEVQAVNQGIYLKYAEGVTSSNFDEHILADTIRHFIVPDGVTVISVLEDTASATVYVIEK